jgi:hypothetical protein
MAPLILADGLVVGVGLRGNRRRTVRFPDTSKETRNGCRPVCRPCITYFCRQRNDGLRAVAFASPWTGGRTSSAVGRFRRSTAFRLSVAPGVERLGHMQDAPACGVGAGDSPSGQFHAQVQTPTAIGTGKVNEGGPRVLGGHIVQEESRGLCLEVFWPGGRTRRGRERAGCGSCSPADLLRQRSRGDRGGRRRTAGGSGRPAGHGQDVLAARTAGPLGGQLGLDRQPALAVGALELDRHGLGCPCSGRGPFKGAIGPRVLRLWLCLMPSRSGRLPSRELGRVNSYNGSIRLYLVPQRNWILIFQLVVNQIRADPSDPRFSASHDFRHIRRHP